MSRAGIGFVPEDRRIFATLSVRVMVAGIGLVLWTRSHALVNLEDEAVLWLIPRWLLGFGMPAVFAMLAVAMILVATVVGTLGPRTNGMVLEELSS